MSSWLAEDPELLEAALEIVEKWDVGYLPRREAWASDSSSTDDAASTISTSTSGGTRDSSLSSSPPFSSTAPSRPPRPLVKPTLRETSGPTIGQRRRLLQPSTLNSTHHKRREEIRYLNRTVAELQRELKSLERPTRDANGEHVALSEMDPMRASIWRDVAKRQQQLRVAAESEQLKLRSRVDAQVEVARGLIKLIQKARRLEDNAMLRAVKRQCFVPRGVFQIEQVEQLTYMDEMYRSMDRFYSHPKFHDGTIKFVDIQIRDDRPQQFVIEVSETWTVPFEEDRVVNALWLYALKRQEDGVCAPEYDKHSETQLEETEFIARFNALATVGSATGSFEGRVIVKRFPKTETSPLAIITSFHTTSNTSTPGDFERVGNHGVSCIRVVPPTAEREDLPITRVTYSESFTVTFEEEDSTSQRHAGLLTNMMLQKLTNNLDSMHATVETMLLTSP